MFPVPSSLLSAPFDGVRQRRGAVRPGVPQQHRGHGAGQGVQGAWGCASPGPLPHRRACPARDAGQQAPKERSLPCPRRRA